ncbi:TetR/AcrR family transcriptional regulator [Actinoalloteichus hymeniacidonis]|uniref:Transcriptional regulator, TetR family n=1 Tax=Actinoalloteichus hymeniacidonis TaxID=340345 RepID=A0AAC9HNC5_9PSEU|nr:TetR/AcrR family transcriptional regulator [Actinoalloteichus hymeniacidonis]AOS62422.1 transcriptional regulator, TetR family [Actinoalloteichus hymeniacidonis]MBB5909547.1 AcrR family transcriptional regulator [Actinoalloteichus hymeniacidonis]
MTVRAGGELGSRDKVLLAAMTMFGENPAARLSVRAVASRAGVSMGSLRYHFPTQRELQDEVLTRIYDLVIKDDQIHDTSVPARDRLVGRLRQVLAPAGVGAQAREATRKVFEDFLLPESTEEQRAAYLAVGREAQRRVEYWLTVLVSEGALAAGDNTKRARFLITLVNGLGLERALPAEDSILQSETDTLYLAVDSLLGSGSD